MLRRPRAPALLAAVLLALRAAAFAAEPVLPLPATVPLVAAEPALEGALLAATNHARGAQGLPALQPDEGLARAARAHAAEMARLGYFAHASPVPANAHLQARLARHGSPLVSIAENLARFRRPGTPAQAAARAVDGWLASPGHRANLLRGAYDRVGFGTAVAADGSLLVVQDLGAEPVTLSSATLVPSSGRASRLVLRYAPPADGALDLFLDGVHQPTARTAPGVLEADVPSDLGPVTIGIGLTLGDGATRVVHRFHLDAGLPFPTLRAGAASDAR